MAKDLNIAFLKKKYSYNEKFQLSNQRNKRQRSQD